MNDARPAHRHGVLSSLVELLLPQVCLGCGQDGSSWCRQCLAVELDPVLHRPDPCPPGLPPLAAAASYTGSVRSAVLAAKERDRRELDSLLGAMLATAIGRVMTADRPPGSAGLGRLWLVPVPAGPGARRLRGRDHVSDWAGWAVRWLLAEHVVAELVPALHRRPACVDSVGLDAGQRASNLRGAFGSRVVGSPPRGTTVVLVDDIVTTGATLVAATGALSAGLGVASPLLRTAVVAATQRHRPRRHRPE